MNIAHAIHGVGLGGAQKIITSIVGGRRDESFRYFVYSCLGGVEHEAMDRAGATVRVLPRLLPKFDPIWLIRLAWAMRRDRIDLVHAHLFGDSLHGLLAARAAGGLPVVLTLHIGPPGWNRLQRLVYPWLLARCEAAIACGESVRRAVAEVHPELATTLQTIPNGIEAPPSRGVTDAKRGALKRSLGVPEDAVVVAGIGRLTAQKAFDVLIQAFGCVGTDAPGPPARLVFMGEGELRDELERQAAAGGFADRVLFAGFRPNVRELLLVTDVVVFSSLYEGLPIALLEAMAAGRCIVATRIPGNLDAVREDRDALIVEPGDVASLTTALRTAISNPQLRGRLGESARQRFCECFTAKAMVERYEQSYRQILTLRANLNEGP